MRMHSFSGATSREVLQKVKQALGDDALIPSNREVAGVIEVVAVAATEADLAAAPAEPAAAVTQTEPECWARATSTLCEPQTASTRGIYGSAAPGSTGNLEGILTEIQSLKSMLRRDMAALSGAEAPQRSVARSAVAGELMRAGFTPELANRVCAAASDQGEVVTMPLAAERLQAMVRLARADEIIDRGGAYALIGPTGVGKTTTVAKLAARCVVRFGASKVALLTTDGYRIGGYDQLRIYARILGVTVHAVRDASDLATALTELSGRHLVLIDTIGMSQRDRMVAEQAAMFAGAGEVKRLLLVQATTNTATLDEIVAAYKESVVHGCIITKADEAASLAPALDAVIRHDLPLHYVTDGQRVPEDLQLPEARTLVREALPLKSGEACDVVSHDTSYSAGECSASNVRDIAPGRADVDFEPLPLPNVIRPLGRHAQMRVVHG